MPSSEAETPGRREGEWITHSTLREVYASWWVSLRVDDVEMPDGTHTEYEVVRGPDAAGCVMLDADRGILMIWRHRFMPDTWGWEVPGGAIDSGETPEQAAVREAYEETGWCVAGPVRHLSTHHPSVGVINQTYSVFLGEGIEHVGMPPEANEAARVEWRSFAQVASDIESGEISDAFTLVATTLALATTGRGDLLVR